MIFLASDLITRPTLLKSLKDAGLYKDGDAYVPTRGEAFKLYVKDLQENGTENSISPKMMQTETTKLGTEIETPTGGRSTVENVLISTIGWKVPTPPQQTPIVEGSSAPSGKDFYEVNIEKKSGTITRYYNNRTDADNFRNEAVIENASDLIHIWENHHYEEKDDQGFTESRIEQTYQMGGNLAPTDRPEGP